MENRYSLSGQKPNQGRFSLVSYGEDKSASDIPNVEIEEPGFQQGENLSSTIDALPERGKGVVAFFNQMMAVPASGLYGAIAGAITKEEDQDYAEAATTEIERAMKALQFIKADTEESQQTLNILNKPFELLNEAATYAGTNTQDLLNKYANGLLDVEAATAVHTAIVMIPAALGIPFKRGGKTVLEGELLPPEYQAPKFKALKEDVRAVEGEILNDPSLPVSQPKLPAPEVPKTPQEIMSINQIDTLRLRDQRGNPSKEIQVNKKGDARPTTNFEQGRFELIRQERKDMGLTPDVVRSQQAAIASAAYVKPNVTGVPDTILNEAGEVSFKIDEEIGGGGLTLESNTDVLVSTIDKFNENIKIGNSKLAKGQSGSLNLTEIHDGLQQLGKLADESEFLYKVRLATQPLQSGTPKNAAIVKNFANNLAAIKEKRRMLDKVLVDIPKENRGVMLRALEHPELESNLSPKEIELVREMKNDMEEVYGPLAVQLGILKGIRKNYAKHVVVKYLNDPSTASRIFPDATVKSWLSTGRRKYETLEEGEAAGIEYLVDFSVMSAARAEIESAIYGKQFVNWVKSQEMGNEPLVTMPGEEVAGYVSINHPAFKETTWSSEKFVSVDGKKVFFDGNTVKVGGQSYPVSNGKVYINGKSLKVQKSTFTKSRSIKVHPNLAGPLRAVLEARTENVFIDSFMTLKSATMQVIMYNPLFHGATVFFKAFPTLPAVGFKNLISPKDVVGADIWKHFSPQSKALARTPALDYVVGNYLNNNKSLRIDATRHNVRFIGGKGYKMDLYGDIELIRGSMLTKIHPSLGEAANKFTDFWHGTLLWDRIGDLQMGLYHRFSLELTKKRTTDFQKQNNRLPTEAEINNMTEASKYEAGEMSNLIVGAFGKEDFTQGWTNFLNLVHFSRSYTVSNLRLAKAGIGMLPKHIVGQVESLGLTIEQNKVFFATLASTTLLKDMFLLFSTLELANYILTNKNDIPDEKGNIGGHFSWNNEPDKKMKIAVGIKPSGQVVYVGTPFRAARDIYELMFSWIVSLGEFSQAWKNKRNPSLTAIMDLYENKNYRGSTIIKPGDSWATQAKDVISHMGKAMTGWEGIYSTANPDDESWRNRWRLLGAQISHGDPGGPLSGSYREIQRNQSDYERLQKQEARDLIKRGKSEDAISFMVDNNFTSGEIQSLLLSASSGETAFWKSFKSSIKKMYRKATPKQKETLDALSASAPD